MPKDANNCSEAGQDAVWGPGQAMEESLKDTDFQHNAERSWGAF